MRLRGARLRLPGGTGGPAAPHRDNRGRPAAGQRGAPGAHGSVRRTGAGGQLALVTAVQILAISCWFSVSAVIGDLRAEWHIDAGQASWLTGAVQLGFAAGAVASALARLTDRVAPRLLIAASALLTALTTVAPVVLDLGYGPTLALRAATGVALAGVYPPGMRVVTSWYRARRGTAVATVVAALTLGTASPRLALDLPLPGWRALLSCAAGAAALAGLLALGCRLGPYVPPARPPRRDAVWALLRDRRQRLATLGYLGHMWELYAMWTWLPSLTARCARNGSPLDVLLTPSRGAFLVIGASGVVGCLAAGWAADRWGRARVAMACLACSGLCCLLTPLLPDAPEPVVVAVLVLWGVTIIGDSPMYSALVGDFASARTVGTALTTQMALGYAVSAASIWVLPLVSGVVGWRWAFLLLGVGPLVGVPALYRVPAAPGPVAAVPAPARPGDDA